MTAHLYHGKSIYIALLLCTGLLACGGGGAGSSTAPAEPRIEVTSGAGHLSVYWPLLAGSDSYQVWYQDSVRNVPMSSRSLTTQTIALSSPVETSAVHTITELDPALTYQVWLRAHWPDGTLRESPRLTSRAIATEVTTASEQSSFAPTRTDLSVLDIRTVNSQVVDSREVYVTASFALYTDTAARSTGSALHSGGLQIRGRGNSSWEQHPKKPYRLKLDNALAWLDMPSNRHWVLLANHSDKTLLRNDVAFELSRRMGFAYTPRSKFVEVFLNGNYLGNYQLTEHLRTGSSRVNVTSLGTGAADNVLPNVSGGYLLEMDRLDSETSFVSTQCSLAFKIESPDTASVAQKTYIQNYINSVETSLYAADFASPTTGYAAYIDVDSFVNWYIHSEVMYHIDAFRFSTFFYKNRNGKLVIGPVWDFDLAMGNFYRFFSTTPGRTDGFGPAGTRCWYSRLLQDSAFQNLIRQRWQVLRTGTLASGFSNYLSTQAMALAQSQQNNYQRWPTLDKFTWPNVVITGTYPGEIEYLDFWLERRLRWLDSQWTLP